MNLVPLRAVFFEKRIPQNLPFVKTWQDMENAKSLPQSLKNDKKRCEGSGWRAEKSCKNAAHLLWKSGKYVILFCMMRHRQAVRQGTLTPPS